MGTYFTSVYYLEASMLDRDPESIRLERSSTGIVVEVGQVNEVLGLWCALAF